MPRVERETWPDERPTKKIQNLTGAEMMRRDRQAASELAEAKDRALIAELTGAP